MLFDTHTHLNVDDFDDDREETILRAREVGVKGFALVGFNVNTIRRAQEMIQENPDMVGIYGWHPTEAIDYNAEAESFLLKALESPKVVAVGETGLDYYWETSPHDVQEKVFRRQLAIAREMHLPIVIHNRDATADCYRILKDEKVGDFGGIMHSYGETEEWVEKFLDLGMHISFSGVSTFKKTDDVRAAAKLVPDDKILIETDSPYLAPVPKRGKRNESAYVAYVAQVLADTRETSLDAFEALTFKNACDLFNLNFDGTNLNLKIDANSMKRG